MALHPSRGTGRQRPTPNFRREERAISQTFQSGGQAGVMWQPLERP